MGEEGQDRQRGGPDGHTATEQWMQSIPQARGAGRGGSEGGPPGPHALVLVRSLLDTAPIGMAVTTAPGVLVWVNEAMSRLTGRHTDDLVGSPITDVVHADDVEAKLGAARQLIEGAVDRYQREERWTGPDGDVWVSVSASLALGPDGTPIRAADGSPYVIRQVMDVSERHRADERLAELTHELQQRNAELERSNDELTQFAYVASHDLSEPLRVVAGHVELLARRYRGRLDDDADRYIAFAVDGCSRMRRLIDDLLAFSRAGREGGEPQYVDLAALTAVVVASLGELVTESGAAVTTVDLPTVVGDPTGLAQVLGNLIANAVKFRRDGETPVVRVDAVRGTDEWTVRVSDNGIGIEPRYRDRIFRLFQRLHGQDSYSGTGIGLAVCRKVVELRGGRIWVEDAPGGGARFCFTVPDTLETS